MISISYQKFSFVPSKERIQELKEEINNEEVFKKLELIKLYPLIRALQQGKIVGNPDKNLLVLEYQGTHLEWLYILESLQSLSFSAPNFYYENFDSNSADEKVFSFNDSYKNNLIKPLTKKSKFKGNVVWAFDCKVSNLLIRLIYYLIHADWLAFEEGSKIKLHTPDLVVGTNKKVWIFPLYLDINNQIKWNDKNPPSFRWMFENPKIFNIKDPNISFNDKVLDCKKLIKSAKAYCQKFNLINEDFDF
ncbi:hypothetical protein [Mycoplasma sp. E35C]|uniref:hypothetical protein n=1 Tax=Mycoplasma sp. E35C TaxID=2801918 RepID=UPI001CA3BAA1|nr:hypothetical protein [Mycoplasma sp. E35C]QZX49437.1 hypothetical protein JJE79_01675 [Mycoplasma sp. E35C]